MIIEIQNINSVAFGAVLAGLDMLGLHELTNVFARWTFELEWSEIADISQTKIDLVIRAFDAGCRSYSIRIDDREYSRIEDDDEPASDIHDKKVDCVILRLVTDQRPYLLQLTRDMGMPDISDLLKQFQSHPVEDMVPELTETQIKDLREIIPLLCTDYYIRVGDITISS